MYKVANLILLMSLIVTAGAIAQDAEEVETKLYSFKYLQEIFDSYKPRQYGEIANRLFCEQHSECTTEDLSHLLSMQCNLGIQTGKELHNTIYYYVESIFARSESSSLSDIFAFYIFQMSARDCKFQNAFDSYMEERSTLDRKFDEDANIDAPNDPLKILQEYAAYRRSDESFGLFLYALELCVSQIQGGESPEVKEFSLNLLRKVFLNISERKYVVGERIAEIVESLVESRVISVGDALHINNTLVSLLNNSRCGH